MTPNPFLGLTRKEIAAYSPTRAVESADTRRPASGFEAELSVTINKRLGRSVSGITVPADILVGDFETFQTVLAGMRARAMSVTTPSAGGYLVGFETLPWLAYAFPRSVAMRAGMTVLPPLSGSDVGLPVESSSTEAECLAEGESATDQSTQFGTAYAKPKIFFAQRTIGKQLLAQSAPAEERLKRTIFAAMGAGLDRAVLVGAGGKYPIGISNAVGISTVSHGTDGGAPTRAKLCEAEHAVFSANAAGESLAYVISPGARQVFKKTVAASGHQHLLETVNGQDFLNGHLAYTTKYMPDNGTKNNGSNLASFVFGEWSQSFITTWGLLDLLSDPYSLADRGQVKISATLLADTLHPRGEMFCRATDISTSS